jgi:hypothetical protein
LLPNTTPGSAARSRNATRKSSGISDHEGSLYVDAPLVARRPSTSAWRTTAFRQRTSRVQICGADAMVLHAGEGRPLARFHCREFGGRRVLYAGVGPATSPGRRTRARCLRAAESEGCDGDAMRGSRPSFRSWVVGRSIVTAAGLQAGWTRWKAGPRPGLAAPHFGGGVHTHQRAICQLSRTDSRHDHGGNHFTIAWISTAVPGVSACGPGCAPLICKTYAVRSSHNLSLSFRSGGGNPRVAS